MVKGNNNSDGYKKQNIFLLILHSFINEAPASLYVRNAIKY